MVLREVARMGLVAPFDLTRVGLDPVEHDLQQGRLADAVGADHRQPVAAHHAQRDVVQHLVVAVGLGNALQLDDLPTARALRRQLEGRVAP